MLPNTLSFLDQLFHQTSGIEEDAPLSKHRNGCRGVCVAKFRPYLLSRIEKDLNFYPIPATRTSNLKWRTPDADQTNGYAAHAQFYAQVAGSHPSVMAYSMSHNATGYEQDMNPDMIDGLQDPRDTWSKKNSLLD